MKLSNNPFISRYGANNLKESKMDHNSRLNEVSGSFLVGEGHSLWLGRLIVQKKVRYFLLFLLLIFVILFGKLFYLQFIKGNEFRTMAEGNRLRLEQVTPARGIIFDRFGVSLVENMATFTLFLSNNELKVHPEQTEPTINLFKEIGLEEKVIEEIIARGSYLPVPVKENLPYQEAIDLLIKIKDLSGLKVEIDQQRNYKENMALAHLLGYTSRINQEEKDYYLDLGYLLTEKVGRLGIEGYYQEELRGVPGRQQIEVDSLGREMKIIAEEESRNGKDIFLSIDAGLQEKIYQTLKSRVPYKAGAVALDPNSGKVRAFVSWPTFDNNEFSQGISVEDYQSLIDNPFKPLFNRLIAGEYPSGSTIKLIMGLAGLEEGLITRNTSFYSTGGIWYDKWFFPDWKAGGHGYTNIIKAIAESVNTYFYYLALEEFEDKKGMGLDKMLYYFDKFGLGSSLGIDLEGEKEGFLPTKEWKEETKGEVWYPGDTLHLAIGQGDILVTPLQVAGFTSAVANGGTLYKTQLLDKIVDSSTGESFNVESDIISQNLASTSNIEIIRNGMKEAVTNGSARGIYEIGAQAAGKTGTAQVGGNKAPHAWFTGFIPYDNPQLVLTVLVENGGDGSEAAVPIARDILSWYSQNRL